MTAVRWLTAAVVALVALTVAATVRVGTVADATVELPRFVTPACQARR